MLKKTKSVLIIGLEYKLSLESFYKKAFHFNGVKKIFFFSNTFYSNLYSFLRSIKLDFLFFPFRYIYKSRLNLFLKKIKFVNLIIVFKGIEIDKKFLLELKNKYPNTKIANIYTDDPFNLASPATSSPLVLDCIPAYDFFFIWSKKIKNKLKRKYKFYKIFYYLPFAYNHRVLKIVKKKINKNYISFVGSGDYYRENIIKKIKKIKLIIFGNAWAKNLGNHTINNFIHGKKLINITAKSYASINILREQNKTSHNMKTFEIPAMGGLLFTTRSQEQNFFFPENKASIMFGSIREFEKKILFLMNNKKIVDRIRQKGFELSRKHSYNNRAKYLLKLINGNNVK